MAFLGSVKTRKLVGKAKGGGVAEAGQKSSAPTFFVDLLLPSKARGLTRLDASYELSLARLVLLSAGSPRVRRSANRTCLMRQRTMELGATLQNAIPPPVAVVSLSD
jgi:hypothetical protein